jgi:hypothetical protein
MPVVSPVFEFAFAKRAYKAKLLRATRPGETDAIVFGLGLNPKLDRMWIVFRTDHATVESAEDWWSAKGRLTPLARAAIAACGEKT